MNNDPKILIPCSKTFDLLALRQIIRFQGLQNYTKIFLEDGSTLLSSCNIGSYRVILESQEFFSCHKSHLINKQHVIRYHKNGEVEMSDHSKVPVARRRKEKFFEELFRNASIMTVNGSI